MFKNWGLLAISLLALYLAWNRFESQRGVVLDQETSRDIADLPPRSVPSPQSSKEPQKPKAIKKIKEISVTEVPPSEEEWDGPPPNRGRSVHFRVVDGLAVAYGDVILGKIDSEKPIKQGYSDGLPTLRFWESPEIPYLIDSKLPQPERIQQVVDYLNQHTPIRLVPYRGEENAILFETASEHCLSVLGKMGGVQPIRLSQGCHLSEILHEVMHALGFIHEQSRPDRDDYVEVLWRNIQSPYQSEFVVVPDLLFEPLRGTPFDYQSVMLYEPNEFAKEPNLETLRSLTREKIRPTREGLSPEDIRRIRALFRL